MPYIDEVVESFSHADASGVSLDLFISGLPRTEEVLALHIIEDPDNDDTPTPFLSRTVSWAFCVDWLSNENPLALINKLQLSATSRELNGLSQIVEEISVPLLKVLVARNRSMVAVSNTADQPDLRLSASMYKVLHVPKSVADVKKLMEREPFDAKIWFMTHLLTLLQDRLLWAVSQIALDDRPHVPLRAPIDDAAVYKMQHPPLALGDTSMDKKTVQWLGYGDGNWLDTVTKFIIAWEEYGETVRLPSAEDEENTLHRLFRSTTQIHAKGILMPVLCNIQEAALALASLKLYDGNAGNTRWHELLQNHTGIELKNTFQNYQFLRAIFAVTVLGPIVLLSGRSLSAKNNDGLTLTQLTQLSLIPSRDESFERTKINQDLILLLIDVAIQGAGILEERLGALVASWRALLFKDEAGITSEQAKNLTMPVQICDPHGPIERAIEDATPNLPVVVRNAVLNRTNEQEESVALRRRSRDEVNYVLNQKHDAPTIQGYVEQVKSMLSTRIADQAIAPVLTLTAGHDPHTTSPQMPTATIQELVERMPRVITRPVLRSVNHTYRPALYSGRGGPLQVEMAAPVPPAVFALPKWSPNTSDHVLSRFVLKVDVFLPRVSDMEIVYPETKTTLNYEWPTTKNRDMGPLLLMAKAARWSHDHTSFRPMPNGVVQTISQVRWHILTPEDRAIRFGKHCIHLVHDEKYQHPYPICPEISSWNESDLSVYFDLFASFEAEDQTWIPTAHFPEDERAYALKKTDYAMNVPRQKLHDRYNRTDGDGPPVPRLPKKRTEVDGWVDFLPSELENEPIVNEDVPIRVLEEEYSHARDRRVTIEQFLYSLHRSGELQRHNKHQRAGALFIRHVPMPATSLPLRGLDSFSSLHASNDDVHSFATDAPQNAFAQFMSPTVFTPIQIAPNGMAKHLRLVLGYAVVFIAIPDRADCPEAMFTDTAREEAFARKVAEGGLSSKEKWSTETRRLESGDGAEYRPYFSVLNGYLTDSMGWEQVVLRPGDDVILQPNTPHCVVALEPCLLVGGLFYAMSCLDKTLSGLLIGHHFGHLAVADDALSINSSRFGILFVRMAFHMRKLFEREATYNSLARSTKLQATILGMDDKSIANLIYILGYLSQMEPSVGIEHNECDEEEDTDGHYSTRRLPRPRATDASDLYGEEGCVYVLDDNLVVNLNNLPRVWQFSPEFHHDYVFTIATELPKLMDLLLETSRLGVAKALKETKEKFDSWQKYTEEAATIRELDRTINAHNVFEKMIEGFIKAAKERKRKEKKQKEKKNKNSRK